jgi:hypothetical protein
MKLPLGLIALPLLVACVSAQPDALQEYPDGFLCELLDPDQYLSTPQEQINVYRELERRGLTCATRGVARAP